MEAKKNSMGKFELFTRPEIPKVVQLANNGGKKRKKYTKLATKNEEEEEGE